VSGTHDTETMATWWDRASDDERGKVNAIPTLQGLTAGVSLLGASPERVRDVLLETLFAAGSDLLLLPIQDAFGWRDRINEPATVAEHNWTFRLPWPTDRLDEVPEARERQQTLRRWASAYGRL